ncbi:MAG: lytic transglycosylase domain-containing protein [Pseudobdellovibrionaceae bacterium]
MQKVIIQIQKYKLPLTGFISFAAGALTVLAMNSQFQFSTEADPQEIQVGALEPVSVPASAPAEEESESKNESSLPFWKSAQNFQSPIDLNVPEIMDIEPEAAPEITSETVDQILSDYQNRIGDDFEIPSLIFNQTKFWFRVYTEFDSNKKIIHDSLHPHIILDVVDISDVMSRPSRVRWLNTVKAEKMVSKRLAEIRIKLKKMARKKKENMDEEELAWLSQYEEIKGNQKKIILTSAQNLRIQTGQKNFFQNGLSISGRYLDGMESIFKERGLPVELTRLPFVESSFVIGATSKVGAAGIWQFMPGIGRQFMMVNDRIDERRNPWKATEAAAKLLKENYIILHKKWGLALTAYNHGPGGVRRAMEVTGSRDIAKIVRSYRSRNFDFASSNFFTCFLAALHAQMYRDLLFPDHVYEPALMSDSMKLKQSYRPKHLVELTGLSAEQILSYNPELDRAFRRNEIVPKGYRLFVPIEAKLSMTKPIAAKEP